MFRNGKNPSVLLHKFSVRTVQIKIFRHGWWNQCLSCWVSPWDFERNVISVLSTHLPHPLKNRCKTPLLEHPKSSCLQMQSIATEKHACKSFSLFGLRSNPVSLTGRLRLIAWRGLHGLLCTEAGHAHASAGEVTSAVETWVCFSLQLRAIAFLTRQQAARHRLLTLLLSQHWEGVYS